MEKNIEHIFRKILHLRKSRKRITRIRLNQTDIEEFKTVYGFDVVKELNAILNEELKKLT